MKFLQLFHLMIQVMTDMEKLNNNNYNTILSYQQATQNQQDPESSKLLITSSRICSPTFVKLFLGFWIFSWIFRFWLWEFLLFRVILEILKFGILECVRENMKNTKFPLMRLGIGVKENAKVLEEEIEDTSPRKFHNLYFIFTKVIRILEFKELLEKNKIPRI